ncbi:MAG: MBL fold metallo-hydrolase [Candidatus Kapabacteria bacterium]|jgi:glyoxylase-like metal-dependent hydrolase (beta-lactamase superfamily II)|nr:MBL fold metallo-hydrolase [Candidatus Kapabacteria bacterium]
MRLVAPNLWQISGFPNNIINTYLIADGNDVVLIDAGTRFMTNRLLRILRRFFALPEHQAKRLTAHVLTHVHPDHQGASKAVCDAYGVPLWCGEKDAEAMERGIVESGEMQGLLGLLGRTWAGPAYPVTKRLREGDVVAGFRVLETPGHTPGHCAFWREADKCLILGDVLNGMNLATGLPGLHEPPTFFTADIPENRRSIRKIGALMPECVCFGHGAPLRHGEKLQTFLKALPQ